MTNHDAGKLVKPSSPAGALFGLFVIWACLYLVALAQDRSQKQAKGVMEAAEQSRISLHRPHGQELQGSVNEAAGMR